MSAGPTELAAEHERVDPETSVVTVRGDVTFANASSFGRTLQSALDEGTTRLVVDISEVRFMDSSGLSALLAASMTARRTGGAVALIHGEPGPPGILRFKGIEQLLRLYPSRAAALELSPGDP